jgi:hypothetical protein
LLVDIGIGGAGTETVVIPDLWLVSSSIFDHIGPTSLGPCEHGSDQKLGERA